MPHRGAHAVEPAIFDVRRPHVGRLLDAERPHAARERPPALDHARVVGVHHEAGVAIRAFEDLGLRVGDGVHRRK